MLAADDNLTYVREFAHLTLVRVLLARYASDGDKSSLNDASRLLARLQPAAVAGGRAGRVIEILVLESLTYQVGGDIPRALGPLVEALTLAEPEGYVRVFVGEGPRMKSLLKAVISRQAGWDYVRRLRIFTIITTADARMPMVVQGRTASRENAVPAACTLPRPPDSATGSLDPVPTHQCRH